MLKRIPNLFFLFLGALVIAGAACQGEKASPNSSSTRDSLYDRVTRAGKIKCGYSVYAPYSIKDPNTGKLSGVFIDAVEEAGRKLGLSIEWSEEVGFATAIEGLKTRRYDMLGSGLWENATRGKEVAFSQPLFFNPILVWVRTADHRFDGGLKSINDPSVRIAVQDGAAEDLIAQQDFPKAKRVSIPTMNPWTDNLLNMESNKADVTFAEPGAMVPYLKQHPGTFRALPLSRPLRVFPTSIPFAMGETEFKSMLDSALTEMKSDGTLEAILQKYEPAPGDFLRTADPYRGFNLTRKP